MFHYLMEKVSNEILCFEHCRNENQIADIMTKPVQVELLKRLKSMISIENLNT